MPKTESMENGGRGVTFDRVGEAYRTIRDLILSHRLAPGTPIIQTDLAERIGHTRVTLRAALQRLTQEGYLRQVDLGSYSRAVVTPLTRADMREVFEVLAALEGMAARRTAALSADQRAAAADRMGELNREMLARLRDIGMDAGEAAERDVALHDVMTTAAGDRIRTQLEALRPQMRRYRDLYVARVADRVHAQRCAEHERIIAAILEGDAVAAQAAVQDHWLRSAARLEPFIDAMGERQGYAAL